MEMLRLQLSGVGVNRVRVYGFVQSIRLKVRNITPKEVVYSPEVKG